MRLSSFFILIVLFFSCQENNNTTAPSDALEATPAELKKHLDFSEKEVQAFFKEEKVKGCFLLLDLKNDTLFVFNEKRSNQPFLPASTFKIPNSMIALEEGVVKDENEVIKWDGQERQFKVWNQDHNLRSAFKYSAVWFYQELARRVGEDKMQKWVDSIGYGNQQLGDEIDMFWLDGDIRISPREQIDFLKRFYNNVLPFSKKTYKIVKDIFILEKTDHYVLRGKTGWVGGNADPQIGWLVGYLEEADQVYCYALNIDIQSPQDTKARMAITRKVFQTLGLMKK